MTPGQRAARLEPRGAGADGPNRHHGPAAAALARGVCAQLPRDTRKRAPSSPCSTTVIAPSRGPCSELGDPVAPRAIAEPQRPVQQSNRMRTRTDRAAQRWLQRRLRRRRGQRCRDVLSTAGPPARPGTRTRPRASQRHVSRTAPGTRGSPKDSPAATQRSAAPPEHLPGFESSTFRRWLINNSL